MPSRRKPPSSASLAGSPSEAPTMQNDKSSRDSEDPQHSRTNKRARYSDTVIVRVTDPQGEETDFTVHKAILVSKTPFFRAACADHWESGRSGIVPLTDTEPQTFEVLLHWIYTDKLDVSFLLQEKASGIIDMIDYCKLWSLAHFVDVEELRDRVISRMLLVYEWLGGKLLEVGDLQKIFEVTTEDTTFRRLFVDIVANTRGRFLEENVESIPLELVRDFAVRWGLREEKPQRPSYERRCAYHEHIKLEPGVQCKFI